MEPNTPKVNTPKVDPPTGVRVEWNRDAHPYVEIWDSDRLVLAGWVYNSPNYVGAPTLDDYWQQHAKANDISYGPALPVVPNPPMLLSPLEEVFQNVENVKEQQ